MDEQTCGRVVDELVAVHGGSARGRAERGVRQVASQWLDTDGTPEEFNLFCRDHFVAGESIDGLLGRFEEKLEKIDGHVRLLGLELSRQCEEDTGPLTAADRLFGRFTPASHLQDDLYASKLAFVALLNFLLPRAGEVLSDGGGWSRRQWAEARLMRRFEKRVPAEMVEAIAAAQAASDEYIASYNIHLECLVGSDGKPAFDESASLIAHWGLRDEIRAQYGCGQRGLERQRLIFAVLGRILSQTIPLAVIDATDVIWDPVSNDMGGKASPGEAGRRWEHLRQLFLALRRPDELYPDTPTYIQRRFERALEMSEARVEELLRQVLGALAAEVVAARLVEELGRPLEPFDVWHGGLAAPASMNERELDEVVARRFPTAASFREQLPEILGTLGFAPDKACFLGSSIEVDAARGSGHARKPCMRGDVARLRTRVPQGGMRYKGFSIAMHELGHNVEQVFSLYRADHPVLAGVPSTAFSECFAFVFQARALDVLGMGEGRGERTPENTLDFFWSTRELCGVALVDMLVWRWLYDNPEASMQAIGQAVLEVAGKIWDQYFAPHLGTPGCPLLGCYSHQILTGLYLPNYPIGRLVAFQVERFFEGRNWPEEMERMCTTGCVSPDVWMGQAVGEPVSAEPLLEAVAEVLG